MPYDHVRQECLMIVFGRNAEPPKLYECFVGDLRTFQCLPYEVDPFLFFLRDLGLDA